MKKNVIFEMESPYRDTMRITSFEFGSFKENSKKEKNVAIVGSTRGNEAQQIYNCAKVVAELKRIESEGGIKANKSILVIPTLNNYSFNINKRFWSLDNTDINRMFPGYELGETTQRIAGSVFESVKDYKYGIQFTSFYMAGSFLPHVRMMHTGYEDIKTAKKFGLPYVYIRESKPYDTTTLNYNWQIWGTKAFSLYIGNTETIDEKAAETAVQSVVRFLKNINVLKSSVEVKQNKGITKVINHDDISPVRVKKSGIMQKLHFAGEKIHKGEVLANIIDPYDGIVTEKVFAHDDGLIFFVHESPFVHERTLVYRILKK